MAHQGRSFYAPAWGSRKEMSAPKKGRNHATIATDYAQAVAAGEIVACVPHRQACERHLRDLEKAKTADWPYVFDEYKAGRICRFVEMLPHVKGEWAKKNNITGQVPTIKLEAWQVFILCMLFGWVKKKNGNRRFRRASCYIPRKNAKSTLGAGIGLFMMTKDNEPGAEIYAGATSEKQAWEIFGMARRMCKMNTAIPDELGISVAAAILMREEDGSKFAPLIGNPGDGSSPHCALIDEYHEHDTSNLRDTMETGMGARSQPLSLILSTAGWNIAGPCREDWKTCEKILEQASGFEDETHFCIIFTVDDPEREWMTEAGLRKANPNFGISVDAEAMLADMRVAMRDPRMQNKFKTKHCNIWANAKASYYNMTVWEKCYNPNLSLEKMRGKDCLLAADFAAKHDIVALMMLFPLEGGRCAVFGKYYLPRATVELPENQHYRAWEVAGHLTVTDGNVTDLEMLMDDAVEFSRNHSVVEMPFDPTRAFGMSTQLSKRGLNVTEYPNSKRTMSEPMKELGALMAAGKIEHDGNPILAWAIANVVGREDRNGNVVPERETPAQKIDPAVSLMFAIGRMMKGAIKVNHGGIFFA